MIGRTIGKYQIVGQLGRGASGTVYRAVDETLDREVAIKILNPDVANADIMKRFRAEATTLARLNHPHIATIFELLPTETDLLMVMEFVRGETLQALVDRLGPLPPDRAAYLIVKILSGLEHAHRAGIVHRDMKPANVMVTDDGAVKIMDFGIARVRGAEQMTIDGSLMGTPAYMAPEQVLGKQIDGRTDLYSVGVILYHLLTGALPFEAETPIAMLHKQLSNAPMPLNQHREGLPEWCEAIVQRALAKSPTDRFQAAEHFCDQLGHAIGIVHLAKRFATSDTDVKAQSALPATVQTLALPGAERPLPGSSGRRFLPSPNTLRSSPWSVLMGLADLLPTVHGLVKVTLTNRLAWVGSTLAVLAASVVLFAYVVPRRSPVEPLRAAALPPMVFEVKALVGTRSAYRERDAQLLLADGKITVARGDDARDSLFSVPYDSVAAIDYSRSRDPMWNSPNGPARVARANGDTLARWGIFLDRDWISLRTNTKDRFVVVRVGDDVLRRVLAALEERTGRKPQVVTWQKKTK